MKGAPKCDERLELRVFELVYGLEEFLGQGSKNWRWNLT
jgi:hypothetical protein